MQLQSVLFMDMTFIARFLKSNKLYNSLGVSPQWKFLVVQLLERWSLFLSKLSVICSLVVEFKKDEYTVGKDASCSLVIKDSHLKNGDIDVVSKKHFKISHKKDGVYLEGLALTYVNDKKIDPAEKTILKHNDRIAIGKMHLKGR